MTITDSKPLICGLQNPALYDHPVTGFKLIETHISWVILTGDYAYKIKKPVDLGFLDFSTLALRHNYCQQELVLNRRLAPQLYLDVVAITGSVQSPAINGSGPVIDYAVKMRQFSSNGQLDEVLARNELTAQHIDQLADTIADFHQRIEIADGKSPLGTAEAVLGPVEENFQQIQPLLETTQDLEQLKRLETWSHEAFEKLRPTLEQRKADGFIRNCHGDMHLANMALIDNKVVIFDCIEFNDAFRWIDVISEVAFTIMDLIDRGRSDFAARLLDRYLQRTGDYAGLKLLQFYQVYRALVRAKVAAIRGHQSGLSEIEKQQTLKHYRDYATLAGRFTESKQPHLFITHGVSGSGKTTLSQPLLEHFSLLRLRSDVERKRLFGLSAEDKSGSAVSGGIYTADASQRTYQRLAELATQIIKAGYSVIVDATFLKQSQRWQFQQLADELNVPFVILHFHADRALLKKWIRERQQQARDASEADLAVLEKQLATEELLNSDELKHCIDIDSGDDKAMHHLIDKVKALY